MKAQVILGYNIDTGNWINFLKLKKEENIIVIDYENVGESVFFEGVMYISPKEAEEYLKNFSSLKFHKSLYVYPGMSGNMTSLL